jgi:hypothetical protein
LLRARIPSDDRPAKTSPYFGIILPDFEMVSPAITGNSFNCKGVSEDIPYLIPPFFKF